MSGLQKNRHLQKKKAKTLQPPTMRFILKNPYTKSWDTGQTSFENILLKTWDLGEVQGPSVWKNFPNG